MPLLQLPSPASVTDDTISLAARSENKCFAASLPARSGFKMPTSKSLDEKLKPSALSILESEAFQDIISASLDIRGGGAALLLAGRRGTSTDDDDAPPAARRSAGAAGAARPFDDDDKRRPDDDDAADDDEDDLFALES